MFGYGQTYSKRRIRLQADIAEAIIVTHEAKRHVARRIVQMAPDELIRESLEHALVREGALDNTEEPINDNDSADESSDAAEQQRDNPLDEDSDDYYSKYSINVLSACG